MLLALVLALPLLAVSGATAPARGDEAVLLLGNSFLAGIRPCLRNIARSAGHDLHVRAYAGQAYLAALALFTTMYRESPVDLWGPRSLSLEQILHDRLLVEELVLGDPGRWNIEAPVLP